MIRHLDSMGRVVLPAEWRRRFGLKTGDEVTLKESGDDLVVSRDRIACVFCGELENLTAFKAKPLCESCRQAVRSSQPRD